MSYITDLAILNQSVYNAVVLDQTSADYIEFGSKRWNDAGHIATTPGYVGLHMHHHPMDVRDATVSHVLDAHSARLLGLALISAAESAEDKLNNVE